MAFDIDHFAETSLPVKYADLDFDLFDEQPLDAQTLRSLRYMCDVEFHTSCFLRDLLVTPSHREEEAGGFMTVWNREEYWHGEALARVLGRADPVDPALARHRTARQLRQQDLGHRQVVVHDVGLGGARLGVEHLVQAGDREGALAHADGPALAAGHAGPLHRGASLRD